MICRRVTYFTDMGMVKYYQKMCGWNKHDKNISISFLAYMQSRYHPSCNAAHKCNSSVQYFSMIWITPFSRSYQLLGLVVWKYQHQHDALLHRTVEIHSLSLALWVMVLGIVLKFKIINFFWIQIMKLLFRIG